MPENPEITSRLSPINFSSTNKIGGTEKSHGPGIFVATENNLSVVEVALRCGKGNAFKKALERHYNIAVPQQGGLANSDNLSVYWCGPDKWYFSATGKQEGQLHAELSDILTDLASVCDQSHGRIKIYVSGENSRDLLAKGMQVDLHPCVFKPGQCAVTQMAHIAVHLALREDGTFEVSFYRSFAECFLEWLLEMSLEFGYQLKMHDR